MPGVFLCCSVCQALEGAPWVGPYSVIQCVRHLMGCFSIVQLQMLVCGEREVMVMAPPPMHDSAVSPCFHGLPPLAFPTKISSHTSPRSTSLQSIAALTQGLLHNPKTPAPTRCTFQGIYIPVQGMYGCGKDCLILIPFRLPQISCCTHSLKCFS